MAKTETFKPMCYGQKANKIQKFYKIGVVIFTTKLIHKFRRNRVFKYKLLTVYLLVNEATELNKNPMKSNSASVQGGSKIFPKGVQIFKFFRSTKLIFPSSPQPLKRPCFGKVLCAAGKILKKQA